MNVINRASGSAIFDKPDYKAVIDAMRVGLAKTGR
jgi:hypothetical protein